MTKQAKPTERDMVALRYKFARMCIDALEAAMKTADWMEVLTDPVKYLDTFATGKAERQLGPVNTFEFAQLWRRATKETRAAAQAAWTHHRYNSKTPWHM